MTGDVAAGGPEGTLAARFRRRAAAAPTTVAVDDGARALSYAELERRANGVAWSVAETGGSVGDPVVLVLGQGAAAVAAVLGVLSAGRAWVPLEPGAPLERLAGLCDRVRARLVLTDRASAARAAGLAAPGRVVLVVDDPAREEAAPPPTAGAGPDTLACVHFTSGSTGRPKGVMDSHAGVLDNVRRYTLTLGIGPADRLTAMQPPAFSGVVSSTFGALLNGAALLPMRADGGRAAALAEAVRARRATIWHSVPSILRTVVAVDGGAFPDVRVVRLEGDRATAADAALVRRHFPAAVVANGLGTTETGLCRQLRLAPGDPLPAAGALPVGYAVPGVDAVVVDAAGRPLPAGEAGEIAVLGRHLALGYWEDPGLTAAAFAPDPGDPARRVYRTGDLGRVRPDGCLEYLGRRDGGLKVLGVRVEPAEVEAQLLAIPGVEEAVVGTRPGRRGEGVLAARVVLAPGGPSAAALRAALAGRLPAALVPAEIVPVPALPVTAAGKLDRAPVASGGAPAPVPPRDADEARLLAIWEGILERDGFGVHDDFASLGGDSLAAAELLAALESEAGRRLPASVIVRASTVAELARELRGAGPPAPAPGVALLQPYGRGAPVVLVHGAHFGTDRYAALVRRLGVERPVWGLDAPPGGAPSLPALAARHVAALRAASPGPPHLVAGFCSAAILAAEIARVLRTDGGDVALALIGIDAGDFPALVSDAARARHLASRAPGARARRHLARARTLDRRRRPAHHAVAARALGAEVRGAWARRRAPDPFGPAAHRPAPVPGHAELVLSDDATARWSADPAADWAGLAASVGVTVLRCGNDDLLREPAVADVARALSAGSLPPGRRDAGG